MAYTVNWITKLITIPQADLTLISGDNYSLDMADVHSEIRRLEWALTDGLWAPEIINFYPTVTLSGIAKTPTVEFKNDYTVQFGGSNYNVSVSGYDTNMADVLVPGNGINVVFNNSVGKVASGSGLDAGQDAKLTAAHAQLKGVEGVMDHNHMMRMLWAVICGKAKDADTGGNIDADTTRIAYMSMDGTTERIIFDVVDFYGTRTGTTMDPN